MQWLIDLVKDAVIAELGIPPTYIPRTGSSTYDWTFELLTIDGDWHDLDLSSIVPAGASAVELHVKGSNLSGDGVLYMRRKGDTRIKGTCRLRCQVADKMIQIPTIIELGVNRIIEYRILGADWKTGQFGSDITVMGWWL